VVRPLQDDDPRQIGPYVLHGRLGSGAMGTVYLGASPSGRAVAVKVARAALADDEEFRERFRREVEMARSVGGFWTAAVVDADPTAARPWLATEYVPGPTLAQAVDEHGPLPEPAVRQLAAGLSEAVVAIHGAALVHRDLKPSNVLLGADGPRVIDFGISQALERVARLTSAGVFLGTPGFLAPEQIVGDDVGPPCDVYALGAVLVYAATGTGPFGEGETSALMYRALHEEPRLDDVPPGLRDLVARCLRRDPSDRPTPASLLAELGRVDPAPEWLPTPVRTLVERYHTELRTHTIAASAATARLGDSAVSSSARWTPSGSVSAPWSSTESKRPTGVVSTSPVSASASASDAAVTLPLSAPASRTRPAPTKVAETRLGPVAPAPATWHHVRTASADSFSGVIFRTSRAAALVWGSVSALAALVTSGLANPDLGEPGSVRLAALAAFVFFTVAAVRQFARATRRPLRLEIGTAGLALTQGRDQWRLPWHAIARAKLVGDAKRPWLTLWLNPGNLPPAWATRPWHAYHGGFRLFPIAHERGGKRRAREVRELRAALAWHAPQAYDPSP
jgi:serine/threonine protein kinase